MKDQNQSDTEEHCAVMGSAEEDEMSVEERRWPAPRRKNGKEINLNEIADELKLMKEEELPLIYKAVN